MASGSTVYGLHAVRSVLEREATSAVELLAQESRRDQRLQPLLDLARARQVTTRRVGRRELDEAADGGRHQGVVLRLKAEASAAALSLDSLLDSLEVAPLLLVLDGVQDPHNLGACLRSAAAAGAHAVIVPKDRAVGLTPVVRKVAVGAAERLPLFAVTNLARTLKSLQARGVWLVGTALGSGTSLYDSDLSGPLALVMGSEDKGLRRLTREQCDLLVEIPMQGDMESLNISVASGVALFESVRQRQK